MKTLVGKIVSLAAVVSAASLTAFAVPPTLDNAMSRDLNHLTLLKGPNLLSPTRPVSTADPTVTFVAPAVSAFQFVPPPTPDTGAVRYRSSGPPLPAKMVVPAAPATEPDATQQKSLPDPASIHFNSKLHPTPTRGTIERVREP